MPGPQMRTDIVDVYVFRRPSLDAGAAAEFLQLRRISGAMAGSWQPVMGHVEAGELTGLTGWEGEIDRIGCVGN